MLDAAGVTRSYRSAFGTDVAVPADTLARLAARFAATDPAPAPLVVPADAAHPELHGTLELADGTTVPVTGPLPATVPAGYHRLHGPDGTARLVIVTPGPLRPAPAGWGWAVQLYAARTDRSWGIGDFTDLAAIAAHAAADGAAAVLVCPLHATRPGPHQQPSPYSPASRLWLGIPYIDLDAVPGAEHVDLTDVRADARALNASRRIDRDAVWAAKLTALERIWAAIAADPGPAFATWRAGHGADLEQFCVWSVLAETHPGPWWDWPAGLTHPDSPAVAAFAAAHAERVRFWAWCQWLADRQLAAACGQGVDLVFDVAVGFDAGSADAWRWQDLLAFDFEAGCPPDRRNPDGQCWGLPPFVPTALVAADLEPFVATIRAGLRHAAGLRIDHVMGWWRLFWVPAGTGPAAGAYVRYPADALLAALQVEAARAGAWVVGEDMGTVEDRVRADMAAVGMLGYRVAMRTEPGGWPEAVMGAVETHDQATVAGILDGSDLEAMRRIGKTADPAIAAAVRDRLCALGGLDPAAPVGPAEVATAVGAAHRWVARSPARLVVATLDDAAGVAERPNMPGTVDEWPNWRIGLPAPVLDVLDGPIARSIVAAFHAAGR